MSRWTKLLNLKSQPASLRECYELFEDFVRDLKEPAPLFDLTWSLDERARLGYLVSAASLIGGVTPNRTWVDLQGRLFDLQPSQVSRVILLACDPDSNSRDALARRWGLRKGLDSEKVVQICSTGVS
ncbi:hypothetical protein ABIC83_002443 [Roseateles asaccharophilus]|uniref:hypothetical protein n=1 Tax=Roseateles asaccharophilus TaxID=582607 RepID=UPI0038369DEC